MSFLVNWKLYMGNYTHIWRKRWQPTPIFLPRESCGWRSRWAAVHRVAQSQTRLKWLSMRACIGEGNGNPFQCSCLDNPRDGGAQWLLSMRSHRVGHDWRDLAAAAAAAYTYMFRYIYMSVHQFNSVNHSCPSFCDPMDHSTPGFPIHHQLLELAQTHIHRVGDTI